MWLKLNADTVFLVPENASGTGISWKKYRHFLNIGIWGIETSFRDIKYAAGMLFFHSRKKQLLLQEIYAKLILYNFSEAVTGGIVVQKRKGNMQYSINFTIAVSLCVEFIRRSSNGADLFELDDLISRHLVPVRPGRSSPRYIRARTATSFLYR